MAGMYISQPTEEGTSALRQRLRGQLLQAGDAEYHEARRVWNGMIDRRPNWIVRCAGAGDVVAAIQFARAHELVVAVKGGGHSYSGISVCDGGLLIDLSPMKGVRVDPTTRMARAEGGATWHDVDFETQAFGLGVTGAQVSRVGIGGLTLGGGFGNLMRKLGMTVDNLVSADVVTADGHLLNASEQAHSDLFWALRGGGGNFGIVTSFEYRLHPIGPLIVGGLAGFEMTRAREVVAFFRDSIANAPDELSMTLAFLTAPPRPFVPDHLHSQPIVALLPCHCGSIERGMADLAAVRALHPAFDTVGPMPYTALQSLIDESSPYGTQRWCATSGLLDEITDDTADRIIAHAGAPSSPFTTTLVVAAGGAAGRIPPDATAYAHRQAAFALVIFGAWRDADQDEGHTTWVRAFSEAMRPAFHGVYVNGLGDEPDRITEAYPEATYHRLVEIKNRYDPQNIFRRNQNIRPTPPSSAC